MSALGFDKIAVIGAGQMGRGIAQVIAQSGSVALLFDSVPGAAQKGAGLIGDALAKLVDKGKLQAADRAATLERIRPVASLADLAGTPFVIEAIVEREDVKVALFRELDALLPAEAILASNTSSISITRLGAATKRPDRVVGMHFMNPVPVMKLVELIRGFGTSEATYQATVKLATGMGKTVVTSQDYPGFIVNRILMPMINEAAYALMEGVASAQDIDAAMQLGTNQPMGPLTLADFIGLDTCLAIMRVLHEGLGDAKYRPCPLLVRLVDSGRLGKKTGHGFHKY